MPRFLRYEVHPLNPQSRFLQYVARQIQAGDVAAVPTAAGYGLVCRLDDKSATDRLCRCAEMDRAPVALIYRDLAQAATYLHVDDRAFRAIRDAGDGTTAFVLRSTRRVPKRLASVVGGASVLHFGGHVAVQRLLDLLDEALLIALPEAVAESVDDLPANWQGALDVALDAGPLPAARPVRVVDLHGLLQARPSLSRWAGAAQAQA